MERRDAETPRKAKTLSGLCASAFVPDLFAGGLRISCQGERTRYRMVADPNEADAVFTGAVVNFTAVPNDLRSRVRPRAAADNLRLAAENAIEVARGL